MEHLIAANYQTYLINQKDELVTTGMYKCEGLFADFIRKFKPGHGQMKSVLTETDRSAKPSVILSAPDVERTDEQTSEITRLTLLNCLGNDILKRRRYALINYEKFSFLIGGYDFDIKNKIRSQPLHDFVYDINNKTSRAIPSFPSPGRVAFGIAPSERYIIIIGGHTYDNVSLSSVYIFDTQNIDEGLIWMKIEIFIFCFLFTFGWKKLPPYPHPLLAPGVAFLEDRVIVIGGYDIVVGETDMLSTHYQMDLNEKVWRRYADLIPPRARTLVICTYSGNELEIYAAGGYTLVDGKAKVIDKIYSNNAKKDKWTKLTDIPNLQMNHAITIAQTKLIISEEIPNSDDPDHPDIRPIRIYDFESGKWEEIEEEQDHDHRK